MLRGVVSPRENATHRRLRSRPTHLSHRANGWNRGPGMRHGSHAISRGRHAMKKLLIRPIFHEHVRGRFGPMSRASCLSRRENVRNELPRVGWTMGRHGRHAVWSVSHENATYQPGRKHSTCPGHHAHGLNCRPVLRRGLYVMAPCRHAMTKLLIPPILHGHVRPRFGPMKRASCLSRVLHGCPGVPFHPQEVFFHERPYDDRDRVQPLTTFRRSSPASLHGRDAYVVRGDRRVSRMISPG